MTSIGDNSDISEISSEQSPDGSEGQQSESSESSESTEATDSIDLQDATLDPAALIEAQQEYGQAEAIEAALTDLVDSTQDDTTQGGRGAFGQGTGDPGQHYSGVEMAEGEVVVDQDWNEGANAPATEEVTVEGMDVNGIPVGDMKDSGEKAGTEDLEGFLAIENDQLDRGSGGKGNVEIAPAQVSGNATPMEEAGAASEDWSPSTDADDPPPLEESTSGIEGESQDDGRDGIGMDHKPIPADEGTLDLDGKGGDIRVDPVVKLDAAEGVIPKLDAEENMTFKVETEEGVIPKLDAEDDRTFKFDTAEGVIPKLEIEGGLLDMKFFKVEGQAGEGGSLIAKDNAYLEGLESSQSLEAALGRAVTDPAFRQELIDNAEQALAEYDLSPEEIGLLGQIDPDGLHQVAEQIRAQFENLEDPAAQTVLGRIISNVLSGGSGVIKDE